MNPDVDLIARSIARDERAFGDLFDRHSTAVYRFAYSLTHDNTEAQEVVQETFVTAWKKLADIRLAGDSMLPWLIVTARHHAQNQRRAQHRNFALPLELHMREKGDIADIADDDVREEIEWVFAAVRKLSATDQRIVELCLYDGRTYKEAALQLGISAAGVGKRVERARGRLRALRDDERREGRQE